MISFSIGDERFFAAAQKHENQDMHCVESLAWRGLGTRPLACFWSQHGLASDMLKHLGISCV